MQVIDTYCFLKIAHTSSVSLDLWLRSDYFRVDPISFKDPFEAHYIYSAHHFMEE